MTREEKIICKQFLNDADTTHSCNEYKLLMELLEQEPRKGHWICDGKDRNFADYHCSECGLKLALCGQDIKQRQDSGYSLFCGGCGAKMIEPQESEDK